MKDCGQKKILSKAAIICFLPINSLNNFLNKFAEALF